MRTVTFNFNVMLMFLFVVAGLHIIPQKAERYVGIKFKDSSD
jgi:hypothetical protein